MLEKVGRTVCIIFIAVLLGLFCDMILSQNENSFSVVRYDDGRQRNTYVSFSISLDEYFRLWKKRLGENVNNPREGKEKFYPRWIKTIDV
jgi:hypothetical protein